MLNLNSSFYNSPTITELKTRLEPKNGQRASLILCFEKLLVFSSDGYTFQNAHHLSSIVDASKKAAELVWNFCIDKKILQKTECGYSAKEWVEDQGLTPAKKKSFMFVMKKINPKEDFDLSEEQIEHLREVYRSGNGASEAGLAYHWLLNWKNKKKNAGELSQTFRDFDALNTGGFVYKTIKGMSEEEKTRFQATLSEIYSE